MRTRILLALIGATCLSVPGAALAQEVSGDIGVTANYIEDDGLIYSHGPAVQGSINVNIGPCDLNLWGSKSLKDREGDEVDEGLSCTGKLDEATEVTASVSNFSLVGDDMIMLTGSVSHKTKIGVVDASFGHYIWHNNPDGNRLQIGFSPTISDKFDLRFYGLRETGFGLDPLVAVGIGVEYHLTKNLSITGQAVAPINPPFDDPRGNAATVGIRFSF